MGGVSESPLSVWGRGWRRRLGQRRGGDSVDSPSRLVGPLLPGAATCNTGCGEERGEEKKERMRKAHTQELVLMAQMPEQKKSP